MRPPRRGNVRGAGTERGYLSTQRRFYQRWRRKRHPAEDPDVTLSRLAFVDAALRLRRVLGTESEDELIVALAAFDDAASAYAAAVARAASDDPEEVNHEQ
jgi:hypothetical protein